MKSQHVARLVDVFETATGSTPPKSNADFYGGDIPFVKPPQLIGGVIGKTEELLSELGKDAARLAPPDTVLVSCIGNLGKVGITGTPSCYNQQINAILPRHEIADPRYMFYQALSPQFIEQLEARASGTTVRIVNKAKFNSIEVSLPSLAEQRRIVAILDEAFAGIATATANAEKNLANARQVFESFLATTFSTETPNPGYVEKIAEPAAVTKKARSKRNKDQTSTGGREATDRPIQGRRALGVGSQRSLPPTGWEWRSLTSLARLESGHTPSRGKSHYWGGTVPWIGIRDAKSHHGETINKTNESVTDDGIANSSARILPRGTVCLSRTASVGYVIVMGQEMATSQDFLNWVCTEEIEPEFLKNLFLAQGKDIFRFSSGSVHQTIYYPEAKGFFVCIPSLAEQREIVEKADLIRAVSKSLEAVYRTKLAALTKFKQSLLARAFSGELTSAERTCA